MYIYIHKHTHTHTHTHMTLQADKIDMLEGHLARLHGQTQPSAGSFNSSTPAFNSSTPAAGPVARLPSQREEGLRSLQRDEDRVSLHKQPSTGSFDSSMPAAAKAGPAARLPLQSVPHRDEGLLALQREEGLKSSHREGGLICSHRDEGLTLLRYRDAMLSSKGGVIYASGTPASCDPMDKGLVTFTVEDERAPHVSQHSTSFSSRGHHPVGLRQDSFNFFNSSASALPLEPVPSCAQMPVLPSLHSQAVLQEDVLAERGGGGGEGRFIEGGGGEGCNDTQQIIRRGWGGGGGGGEAEMPGQERREQSRMDCEQEMGNVLSPREEEGQEAGENGVLLHGLA